MDLPGEATLAELHHALTDPLGLTSSGRCVFIAMNVPDDASTMDFSLDATRLTGWRSVFMTVGGEKRRGVATCDESRLAIFDAASLPFQEASFADCGAMQVALMGRREKATPEWPITMGMSSCQLDSANCAQVPLEMLSVLGHGGGITTLLLKSIDC